LDAQLVPGALPAPEPGHEEAGRIDLRHGDRLGPSINDYRRLERTGQHGADLIGIAHGVRAEHREGVAVPRLDNRRKIARRHAETGCRPPPARAPRGAHGTCAVVPGALARLHLGHHAAP
jgi:hypothetical protein